MRTQPIDEDGWEVWSEQCTGMSSDCATCRNQHGRSCGRMHRTRLRKNGLIINAHYDYADFFTVVSLSWHYPDFGTGRLTAKTWEAAKVEAPVAALAGVEALATRIRKAFGL